MVYNFVLYPDLWTTHVLQTNILLLITQKLIMTAEQVKQFIAGGEWLSITPEIRPSTIKNADGSIKPFYLSRAFVYFPGDTFQLTITNYADAYGKIALAKMLIKGRMEWKGEHPIAQGAQKVDYIADGAYEVTPLLQPFADAMNQFTKGFDKWEINKTQSILRKAFPSFGLAEGQIFSECDLIYIFNDLMFWGARNVDGRPFDKEENRPTNLQIPLVRSK
jgi:hypothetical protein